MTYNILLNKKRLNLAILFFLLFLAGNTRAQEINQERSYTAPRSQYEWEFLGNTETSKWEYDERTLIRSDSSHLRIRIKETPLKNSYCDVRGAKMWEQRSIQGYSDTLRLHPQWYYEGYERFGFTVLEETIDLSNMTFMIKYAADYDLSGLLLRLWDDGYDIAKPIEIASPEMMIADHFSKDISRRW